MIMPNTWRYMDVYAVIIHYITTHLNPTNYMLNFGIIALHEVRPRVIVRFTLKNTRNNMLCRAVWCKELIISSFSFSCLGVILLHL